MRKLFYLSLLLFAISVPLANSQYYPITTDQISTTAISFDTSNPYQCSCDLTLNSCDYYCCCDTTCSSTIRSEWRNSGLCLITLKSHQFCTMVNNAFKLVHVANRRNIESTKFNNATGKGICVDVSPDPDEFKYTTLLTSTQLTQAKALSFIYRARNETLPPTTTTTATAYKFGANVLLSDNTSLTIQTPDPFGNCENSFKVQFGVPVDGQSCTQRLTTATCTGNTRFSINYYTGRNIIGNISNATVFPTITLQALTYINATTGQSSDITSAPRTPDVASAVCENVVTEITYYFVVNNTNRTDVTFPSIETVLIVGTITDVAIPTTGYGIFSQKISVQYLQTGDEADASVLNQVSGNPGYIKGKSLRVGTVATSSNGDYINIQDLIFDPKGIDPSGVCLLSTDTTSAIQETVAFGQDASYSCTYTITNLATFCQGTTATWKSMGLFNNFVVGSTYVGVFGNANPLYIRDFLAVSGTNIGNILLDYTSSTGVCNFYTHSTVTIYWSTVGYYESPQAYIANVEVSFDWNTTMTTTGSVDLQLNIKYVNIDNQISGLSSGKRPSIIPQLPKDILYPIFYPTEESATIFAINYVILGLISFVIALL